MNKILKYLNDLTSLWLLQFVKSIGNHSTKVWCLNENQIDIEEHTIEKLLIGCGETARGCDHVGGCTMKMFLPLMNICRSLCTIQLNIGMTLAA